MQSTGSRRAREAGRGTHQGRRPGRLPPPRPAAPAAPPPPLPRRRRHPGHLQGGGGGQQPGQEEEASRCSAQETARETNDAPPGAAGKPRPQPTLPACMVEEPVRRPLQIARGRLEGRRRMLAAEPHRLEHRHLVRVCMATPCHPCCRLGRLVEVRVLHVLKDPLGTRLDSTVPEGRGGVARVGRIRVQCTPGRSEKEFLLQGAASGVRERVWLFGEAAAPGLYASKEVSQAGMPGARRTSWRYRHGGTRSR